MKKIVSILLSLSIIFSISITAFASEASNSVPEDKILVLPDVKVGQTLKIPVGDAEYIDDGRGNIIKISDLMSFDSQAEANNYIDNLLNDKPIKYNPTISFAPIKRATHGDVIVARQSVATGSINLGVVYTTSGDSHTGTITSHEAYTTFTGFTLGFGWDESLCSSQITSSGKDIYAVAKGTLTYNLLVDGFIELGRKSVYLDGYCYAIH